MEFAWLILNTCYVLRATCKVQRPTSNVQRPTTASHRCGRSPAAGSPLHVARCTLIERHTPRQLPAAEKLERGTPARRDVGDAIGDASLRHRRNRIAAAD